MDYRKIDDALSRGELWRAKEILRGRVGSAKYDPTLFERYGVVLLATADLLEAGKFLFLSGIRKGEYSAAISLFVNRFVSKKASALFYALPHSVQKTDVASWPLVVIEELKRLNVDVAQLQRKRETQRPKPSSLSSRLFGYFLIAVFIGFVILFLIGVLVGFGTVIGWVFP